MPEHTIDLVILALVPLTIIVWYWMYKRGW
jgi:hypothetical protein